MVNTQLPSTGKASGLPARAGVSLKSEHYFWIDEHKPDIAWFEVHPENYMGNGGLPHYFLRKFSQNYPISMHGVGLSLGGEKELDRHHLNHLKQLNERYHPVMMSEHLAWSRFGGNYFNDLLPFPYNKKSLQNMIDHVDETQNYLNRKILIENPSVYGALYNNDMSEVEFVTDLVKATDCGLLLDVNNVYVTMHNIGGNAHAYLDNFPMHAVEEVHLAGHTIEVLEPGHTLLIDTHSGKVAEPVWQLYEQVLLKTGPVATLIEWDTDIPDFEELMAEAKKADAYLQNKTEKSYHPHEARNADTYI